MVRIEFDILSWWMVNCLNFSIIEDIAWDRDVLAIAMHEDIHLVNEGRVVTMEQTFIEFEYEDKLK
uniref:Uncharacterized protein n=1 Tax=Brassica oleracea var. oleracea TaxID=109376 RepID=A0A0D3BUX4_BRAOL